MAAQPPFQGGVVPDSRKEGRGSVSTGHKDCRKCSPNPPIAILVEEYWVEFAMVLRNPPPLASSCSGMSGAQIGKYGPPAKEDPLTAVRCVTVATTQGPP